MRHHLDTGPNLAHRVHFYDLRIALELVAATEDTAIGVQLTKYRFPGAALADDEQPIATIDFDGPGDAWYIDAMEVMRDLCYIGKRLSRKARAADACAARVWTHVQARESIVPRKEIPPHVGRVWLHYLYTHYEHWGSDTSIEALWRLGGRSALVQVFAEAYDELGDYLWSESQ